MAPHKIVTPTMSTIDEPELREIITDNNTVIKSLNLSLPRD